MTDYGQCFTAGASRATILTDVMLVLTARISANKSLNATESSGVQAGKFIAFQYYKIKY
jgi:hypothetical protein